MTKKIPNGINTSRYGSFIKNSNSLKPNKTWIAPKIPGAKNKTPISRRIDCLNKPRVAPIFSNIVYRPMSLLLPERILNIKQPANIAKNAIPRKKPINSIPEKIPFTC